MTSKAAKKRARRAGLTIRPRPRAAKTTTRTATQDPDAKRQKTGLEWMLAKKRLTQRQLLAGMRYGLHYRLAEIAGMDPLRSCLNDEPRGVGGVMTLSRSQADTDAREKLLRAREALAFHTDMIAACDLICGRGFTPWEVIERAGGKQRDAEKLQTVLGLALDLLTEHYRAER